jgi:hypothetical protein
VLRDIRIPALALNALNDPFVPAASLPIRAEVGSHVTLWQPARGGHVGFPVSLGVLGLPGHVRAMPQAVGDWLMTHLPPDAPSALPPPGATPAARQSRFRGIPGHSPSADADASAERKTGV